MGTLVGFIGFTIHFQPLLEYKKEGLGEFCKSAISIGTADIISNHSVNSAKFAFQELEYGPAISVISHELKLSLEALKVGPKKREFDLTVSMLGACLAKANNDQKKIDLFERSAVAICNSMSGMESCERDRLYEFIRKYAETDQC